jgi:hypothetical protein
MNEPIYLLFAESNKEKEHSLLVTFILEIRIHSFRLSLIKFFPKPLNIINSSFNIYVKSAAIILNCLISFVQEARYVLRSWLENCL